MLLEHKVKIIQEGSKIKVTKKKSDYFGHSGHVEQLNYNAMGVPDGMPYYIKFSDGNKLRFNLDDIEPYKRL